ncbi:hypothetical protein BVX98_01320 [bacterium F11]|nr:hypothetical protein BVX98_01320 [bacterium F11]
MTSYRLIGIVWLSLLLILIAGPSWSAGPAPKITPQKGEWRGEYMLMEVDFEDGRHLSESYLKANAETFYKLQFAPHMTQVNLKTKDYIAVKGQRVGNVIKVEDLKIMRASKKGPILEGATGEQKLLVLLVNFPANPELKPFTPDQALEKIETETIPNFHRVSYGKLTIQADVEGWYTLPVDVDSCNDRNVVIVEAEKMAQRNGVDVDQYRFISVIFPNLKDCDAAGVGVLGGIYSYALFSRYARALPRAVLDHELGHNLGVHHASGLDCGTKTLDSMVNSACTGIEYGDVFDLMGDGNLTHFDINLRFKERLGWVRPEEIIHVRESGDYILPPYEEASALIRGLKYETKLGSMPVTYYAEYRTILPHNYSNVFEEPPKLEKVLLHLWTDDEIVQKRSRAFLLDITPDSSIRDEFDDAGLGLEQRFMFPDTTDYLEPVSQEGDNIKIQFYLNPHGTVGISSNFIKVYEGESEVVVVVERRGGSEGDVSVQYSTEDDSAVAGVDYVPVSGMLFWRDRVQQNQTITISLLGEDDDIYKGQKDFNLVLSHPKGGPALGWAQTGTIGIVDDENRNLNPLVQFSSPRFFIAEDDSERVVRIPIQRVRNWIGEVSFNYRTIESLAREDFDYEPVSGSWTWDHGEGDDVIVEIPIINDAEGELIQDFGLEISDVKTVWDDEKTQGLNNPIVTQIFIEDDELENEWIMFKTNQWNVVEDVDGEYVEVIVQRRGRSQGEARVHFRTRTLESARVAEASFDFEDTSGVIVWGVNDFDDKTIRVKIINDNLKEWNTENFEVELFENSNGVPIMGASAATVIIQDDDSSLYFLNHPGAPLLDEIDEGTALNEVNFHITRNGNPDRTISVEVHITGITAFEGEDYRVVSPRTFTWEPGDYQKKVFKIEIINDEVREKDESFNIALANPSEHAELKNLFSVEVILKDDDGLFDPVADAGYSPLVFNDYRGNGVINVGDFYEMAMAWNTQPNHPRWNDLANFYYETDIPYEEQIINSLDLNVMAKAFGSQIEGIDSNRWNSDCDIDEGGDELVQLDGSYSYDLRGSVERYVWKGEDGTVLGEGVYPWIRMSVGTHRIFLTVQDDSGAWSEPDEITVIVRPFPPITQGSPVVVASSQFLSSSRLEPNYPASRSTQEIGVDAGEDQSVPLKEVSAFSLLLESPGVSTTAFPEWTQNPIVGVVKLDGRIQGADPRLASIQSFWFVKDNKEGKPNPMVILDPFTLQARAHATQKGIYNVGLVGWDPEGSWSIDYVRVGVGIEAIEVTPNPNPVDNEDISESGRYLTVHKAIFNPALSEKGEIALNLRQSAEVKVVIYDRQGIEIIDLLNTNLPPGTHTIHWDGRDKSGSVVPSGSYPGRIIQGSRIEEFKLVVSK